MKRQVKQILGLSAFAAGCMALGMGLSHGWVVSAQEEKPVVVEARGLDRLPPIADVAEKLNPTVVAITNTSFVKNRRGFEHPQVGGQDFFDFFFGPGGPQQRRNPRGGEDEQRAVSGGSGVIISPQGEILTNYHVIASMGGGDNALEVKTNDGKTYKATVLGKDKELDIALIKIDAAHLPFAKLGESDSLRIGEWVVAIGNPFGLEHTVTQGIISAKGRKLDTGVSSFLQTDAAINRGNSGGPLLNLRGEVVGINTAINPAGQNIGFAVPISQVSRILKDLRSGKPVSRGYLGIGPAELDQAYQDALGVKEGVVVSTVEKDQAADKAKVQRLDVITAVEGQPVRSPDELVTAVSSRRAGETLKLTIWRDGKTLTLTATLGDRKAIEDQRRRDAGEEVEGDTGPKPQGDLKSLNLEKTYGFTVEAADPKNRLKGVVVTSVDPRSPAADRSLAPGMIITEVGRQPVNTLGEFNAAVKKAAGRTLLLFIQSPNGNQKLTLAIPPR
ncbi:MAG: trypsin-like peptidase domain-containing protein [Geothrix sp.]|jgi:serine protease Do|uniref:Trypsin-like peptidase domain-containing protein n=1 Tax=Candidatus Geothrix odensensis TaxID=2954440 RepID=A0A936F0J2_9BACT|nr:trypsin-like peptidase domain-containing protein [Candidatus Geothrix odensensis]MBK8790964.1 trypsin-like peptidase domain-containing protein [Holophagaceae bacterium]MBP7616937.1 trypsin-like peptidase domain-containing protein [Geothrix sp.]MCC6513546.1 trypsin-like peptidase domain-containing protein [Geothrix sp.]